jgi:hypothetical protein
MFTLLYLHPLRVSLLYDSILLQYTGDLQFNLNDWAPTNTTMELNTYKYHGKIGNYTSRHLRRINHLQTLLKNWSPTETATEFVPLQVHLQKWSQPNAGTDFVTEICCDRTGPIDTSRKLITDRHCYIPGRRQTLLQNWSQLHKTGHIQTLPSDL